MVKQETESMAEKFVKLEAENKLLREENEDLRQKLKCQLPPKIDGFLLDNFDPYGKSVIRDYRRAGGKSSQRDNLPFVLPRNEEASKKALASYILRADGAADKIRADAARKEMAKEEK
jgi:hypothetical protein